MSACRPRWSSTVSSIMFATPPPRGRDSARRGGAFAGSRRTGDLRRRAQRPDPWRTSSASIPSAPAKAAAAIDEDLAVELLSQPGRCLRQSAPAGRVAGRVRERRGDDELGGAFSLSASSPSAVEPEGPDGQIGDPTAQEGFGGGGGGVGGGRMRVGREWGAVLAELFACSRPTSAVSSRRGSKSTAHPLLEPAHRSASGPPALHDPVERGRFWAQGSRSPPSLML